MKLKTGIEQRCISYAFRLLKYRDRSEKEIEKRLSEKKYSKDLIQAVVSDLKATHYIDDKKFAKQWTNFRLKCTFSLNRISLELRRKGIAEDIISEILESARKSHIESDILLELATKRIEELLRGEKDKIKVKRRVYDFLLRRGFYSSDIMDVLYRLLP